MVTVFPKGAGAQSEAVHRGDEGKGILSACNGQPGLEDLKLHVLIYFMFVCALHIYIVKYTMATPCTFHPK